jgi:hypothetical protein
MAAVSASVATVSAIAPTVATVAPAIPPVSTASIAATMAPAPVATAVPAAITGIAATVVTAALATVSSPLPGAVAAAAAIIISGIGRRARIIAARIGWRVNRRRGRLGGSRLVWGAALVSGFTGRHHLHRQARRSHCLGRRHVVAPRRRGARHLLDWPGRFTHRIFERRWKFLAAIERRRNDIRPAAISRGCL